MNIISWTLSWVNKLMTLIFGLPNGPVLLLLVGCLMLLVGIVFLITSKEMKNSPLKTLGVVIGTAGLTALIGVGLAALSIKVFRFYGWTLFVGLPFLCGFISVVIYSFKKPRDWKSSIGVSFISLSFLGISILIFAIDGLMCLMMALPLAVVLAFLGASLAQILMVSYHRRRSAIFSPVLISLFSLPFLMDFEAKWNREPPLIKVITTVDIQADIQTVWDHVVAFSEIPEPKEIIFRFGIAYPKKAEIKGKGVGAIRRCVFSTGDFVEPITVWDEPHLLKFDVIKSPPPMKEWSFYPHLDPLHFHFMISQQGQFRLMQLNSQTTRLEGTTWYYHRLWPNAYWRWISDEIIHQIHLRVLNHIKKMTETNKIY